MVAKSVLCLCVSTQGQILLLCVIFFGHFCLNGWYLLRITLPLSFGSLDDTSLLDVIELSQNSNSGLLEA